MKILDDSFMVCTDCLMAIANDDYSGLDYHYSESEAGERMREIQDGIANAGGHIIVGHSDKDRDFSSAGCDCCGSRLAGSLHHCLVVG